jgi:predicted permease
MRPWGTKRLFRHVNRSDSDVRVEITDEFAFHLDMRTDELVRGGLSYPDARAQAIEEFGRADASARALARLGGRVERRRRFARASAELRQDATLGIRLLRRNPGFTVVAVLTLALGIGANTAIYSVLDSVLLRPLPYPQPDRVVLVSETLENGNRNSSSGGAFLDWRTHQTQFDALVLTGRVNYNLRGAGTPERLTGMEVSHEFLDVLGIPPLLGRGFLPEEDRPGGPSAVVMITEELWRSRFGADPALVGRTIVLDEIPRTVIGVLARGAWMLKEDSFFVPAVLVPGTVRASRQEHWAGVFGRLSATATVAQADAELKSIKQQLNAEYPAFKQKWGVQVQPVRDVIGGVTRSPMLILFAAVSVVLLIACANVANLLLARSFHRRHELAVRAALGATRGRLMRQVLTENLVLAIFGGLAGIVVAYGGVEVLLPLTSHATPIAFTPRLDFPVLLFSLAITLAAAPLVGLLPAWRARRTELSGTMNTGSKGAGAGGRQRTQSLLVIAEVALTVVLLASAGLLLRSLARTASADPGFEPARVLAFDLSLPNASYGSREKRLAFSTALLSRLRGLPGVEAAGTGMAIPFGGGGFGEYFRRPDNAESEPVIGRMDFVSPGYLEAIGVRLMAGRLFNESDNALDGPRRLVISDATARRFFPAGGAVGRPLVVRGQTWDVVGVIGDVVDRRLDVPRGAFGYVPSAFNLGRMSVAMRTSLDPSSLVASVRGEVARLDPGVAVASPRALDAAMADSMAERKVVLALVLTFAVVALALAATGLYGVMAYSVATRRHEFGIRMAFGATQQRLLRQVLGSGLRVTTLGLVIGLAAAAGAARLLASQLYQVRGSDPLVIIGTTVSVVMVATVACWIPARRASRFEVTVALRGE